MEGSESLVLESMDFNLLRVSVLMVENKNPVTNKGGESEQNLRVRKYMRDRWGYVLAPPHTAHHSDVFLSPEFAKSIRVHKTKVGSAFTD